MVRTQISANIVLCFVPCGVSIFDVFDKILLNGLKCMEIKKCAPFS